MTLIVIWDSRRDNYGVVKKDLEKGTSPRGSSINMDSCQTSFRHEIDAIPMNMESKTPEMMTKEEFCNTRAVRRAFEGKSIKIVIR